MDELRERKFIKDIMAESCDWQGCGAKPGEPCRTPKTRRRLVHPLFHERRGWKVRIALHEEMMLAKGIHKCPMCNGQGRIKVGGSNS